MEEESEASQSDCSVSSSEDDLQIIGSKKVQDKHANESSSDGEQE